MKPLLSLLAALLPLGAVALDDAPPPWRQTNLAFVAAAFSHDAAAASNRPDLFARRGLLADRQAGTVRVWAEATGITDREIEFFLIPEQSGHNYEALAVSFAQPSDIHDALVFLGMTPGRPVDPAACRFWPKGERVLMIFKWTPPSIAGEPVTPVEEPAERLIFDRARQAPLPARGFVFTGSRRIPHPQDPARTIYAADLFNPNSIASAYNDIDTVLDVPHQAGKSAVYGRQIPNPDCRFEKGQRVTVILRPERADGSRRVRDLLLEAAPAGETGQPPAFVLSGLESGPLSTRDPAALLAAFQAVTNRHQDAFVSWTPHPAMSLDQVRTVAGLLDLAEADAVIRMEPPAEGHLYFRAFLPDEKFRNREAWIVKPWELALTAAAAGATGTLTTISEKWDTENAEPAFDIETHPAASPEALKTFLASRKRETPVMVIHAPAGLPYGVLADYARAILPSHPTIWVFLK